MMSDEPIIVSLDWDYVTGDCYTFRCCGFCNFMGLQIGRGLVERVRPDWFERLKYLRSLRVSKNIPIYVAECHASIQEVFSQFKEPAIYDFDSHCDN
jgi:hypothetical protein